ncbi:hypothetical protein [Saccharibacillus sacchari]|uniref:Uncharacterized protein n=1 Tax=Saccharibacillus sacchari TaxID=456493 RepID=A0ACC6PGR7_9BACL
MSKVDGAKPFDADKREQPRLVLERRTESEPIAENEQIEIRDKKPTYRHGDGRVFVRAWNSAKFQEGRVNQPWYERLSRIRNGEDPR